MPTYIDYGNGVVEETRRTGRFTGEKITHIFHSAHAAKVWVEQQREKKRQKPVID